MNSDLTIHALQTEIEKLKAQLADFQPLHQNLLQKIQDIQERWDLVLQGTNDGIWDWNIQTNALFISPRWQEMLGYQPSELVSHFETWHSLLHPQDRERVLQSLQDYLAQKVPSYAVEFRLKSKGGSYQWILSRGQAKWDNQGRPIRMAGSHTDISERKMIEESLELEKTLLRSIIDCIPDSIFYKNHRGIYLACNQAFQNQLGKDETEIIGATNFDLFDSKMAILSRQQDQEMTQSKKPQRHEEWVIYPDGKRRLLDTLKTPLFGYQNAVIGLIGISRDITDRNQKEIALQKQVERNHLLSRIARQLIDQNLDLAIQDTLQKIGQFTDSDRAYMIHYSSSQEHWSMKYEWCREGIEALIERSQDAPKDTVPWFSQQLLKGHSIRINCLEDIPLNAKVERSIFQKSTSPTLVVAPMIRGGKPFGYLGLEGSSSKIWLQEDIDFLKLVGEFLAIAETRFQAEEALKKAKEDADAANRAKSDFLASMSHELRTPLNAILGFTQVMNRDNNLNVEQRQNINIISRSGEHLLDLINDILEMSKIEAGRISLNKNSFDLYHLLDSLESLLQGKAQTKGLQLIFERTADVSQYIQTDEGKLRQVLLNLLGNALKFTHEGGIILRIKKGHQFHRLLFEIEDTGEGIAPEEIPQLFEAFSQTKTGRKAQQGTGLGLSISQKFVQLMGGDIQVSSAVGKGSLFLFEITIEIAEESQVNRPKNMLKVIGLAPNQPIYRILVVDDRHESRQLLLKLLLSVGFEVEEARNGKEAIGIWEKWHPHLIWMDIRMPIMDGYEATQRIKATPQGKDTMIIALTASAFSEDCEMVLSAGCDDFMRKPFREEVLWQKMADYLGVQYVYEETNTKTDTLLSQRPKLATFQQLKDELEQIPQQWLSNFHRKALECDDDALLTLINDLPPHLSYLSQTLHHWNNNYLFEQMIELIENLEK